MSSAVPRGLHGYGDQSGNSRGDQLVDRLDDLGDLLVGRAPRVDAQARLLLDEAAEALHVRAVGRGVDEPLQADVLVGPDRPPGAVAVVDVELVGEDLVALLVALGVARVDGAELADPDRRPGLALVARALEELLLQEVAVDPLALGLARVGAAEGHAGARVVVAGIDGVLVGLGEHREVRRVRVAVDEDDVVGVDLADGGHEPVVERPDDRTAGVRGLVEQVVAADPRLVAIARGERLPQVHHAVLEVRVLPEGGDVRRVVGMPVLVLAAGRRVQVDHAVDAVLGAQRARRGRGARSPPRAARTGDRRARSGGS